MMWFSWIFKALGLLAMDSLMQGTMEEGVFDI